MADLLSLDGFPAIAALRDAAPPGLEWATEADSKTWTDDVVRHYAGGFQLGVVWTQALMDACRAVVTDGIVYVAAGPGFETHLIGGAFPSQFFAHPAHPDSLYFCPGQGFPAALWIQIPATVEAVRELFEEFSPTLIPRADLPREVRAYMGCASALRVANPYSGELDRAGLHELARHFNSSPAVEDLPWGSAFADDPWHGEGSVQVPNLMMLSVYLARMQQQREGATARYTRRTVFSRSHLTIELHQGEHYVWEVRYRPSRYAAPIKRFNEITGQHLPEDLPFDVACAVHGFEFFLPERIEAQLRSDQEPKAVMGLLRVLAAVRHVDISVTSVLREYAKHPDMFVRGIVFNVAQEYNWEFLLEDLAIAEPPGQLAQLLELVFEHGIPRPAFTDSGEPTWLYEGQDNDEDEDDEYDEESAEESSEEEPS